MLRFLQFSFVFFTAVIVNGQNTFDSFKDRSVAAGTNFNYTATTSTTAIIEFSKANKDYINVNTLSDDLENTDRSVFMWIKAPTNVSSTRQYMFGINAVTGSTIRCSIGLNKSERLIVYDGATIRTTTTDLGDDQWHYVGYTYNNSTYETKIYVDGRVEKTYTNTQTTFAGDRYSIGQHYAGTTSTARHYDGALSEVSVWNTILDKTDIATAMNTKIIGTHIKYANLVGYYNGFGTVGQDTAVLEDKSGNSNTGIVTNFGLNYSLADAIVGYNALDWYTSYEWYQNGNLQATDTDFSVTAVTDNFEIKLYRDNITASDTWSTTIVGMAETIDEVPNENICSKSQLTYKAITHKVAPFTFDKTAENFVDLSSLQNDLSASDRSVFMWIKAPSILKASQYLFSINGSTGGVEVSAFGLRSSGLLSIWDGGKLNLASTDLRDDTWHYVGYTYDVDSNETNIYIDGVVEKTFTNDQDTEATDVYSLGQEYNSGLQTSNFYDGLMTEVSVWDAVLLTNEVKAIMNSSVENTHAKYANLVGYYNFPENNDNGTVLKDWSVKGNDGVVYGDVTSTTIYENLSEFNSAGLFSKTWFKNGAEISTEKSVDIWPFIGTDSYTVVLERDFLEYTENWDLTYAENITIQPQDVSVNQGNNANFSVSAVTGSTHQWYQMFEDDDFAFKSYPSSIFGGFGVKDVTISGDIMYVAVDGGGVYVSADKGLTWDVWTEVSKGLNSDFVNNVFVNKENVFIANRSNKGAYSYSNDGGATFSTISRYPTSNGSTNSYGNLLTIASDAYLPVHFDFDSEGNVYALCQVYSLTGNSTSPYCSAVLKSTNGGVSFSLLFKKSNQLNVSAGLAEGGITVDGDKILIHSGRAGFAFTNDGGTTVQEFNNNSFIGGFAANAGIIHGDKLYLGTDNDPSGGGLYETDINGSYFTQLSPTKVESLTVKQGKLYCHSKASPVRVYDLNTETFLPDLGRLSYGSKLEYINDRFYVSETKSGLYVQKYSELLVGETVNTFTKLSTTLEDNENKYMAEVTKDGCTNETDLVKLFVKTGDIVKPVLQSTSPVDEALAVVVVDDMTFTLDFDEDVQKGSGTILIRNTADKTYVATIDIASSGVSITNDVVTITPTAAQVTALETLINAGQDQFYIEVPKEAFTDANGNTFAGIIEGNWDFTGEVTGLATDSFEVETTRLSIYPNPVVNTLHINNLEVGSTVELYSIKGRLLYSGSAVTIDMSVYSSGLYLLHIVSAGNRAVFKVLK